MALRIIWRERDLQWRVRSAGGRWDRIGECGYGGGTRRDAAERLEWLDRVVGRGGGG